MVQEQDRLGMKSQLEGAWLGLPLQGGAWGHDPGSRRPRREAAFREEVGVGGKHTHTAAWRGREENKLQETEAGLERGLGCRFPGTTATLQAALRPCSAFVSERPSAGGGRTWTGEGGWAWGAEGPGTLGEHGPSQVPCEGKLRQGRGPVRAQGVVVKCLADSAPLPVSCGVGLR